MRNKKVGAIVQARMTSSRLPGKVLLDIMGKPSLQRIIERLRATKKLDDIIVATTTNETDSPIINLCEKLDCNYFRGSEEDVLSRVLETAMAFEIDTIVEVTADCPLLDWNHVDTLVDMFLSGNYDHVSNIIERTFPRGYDIRVFSRESLERTNKECDNFVDRSHCSTWQYLNPKGKQNYKVQNWAAPEGQNRPDLDITLDTPEDLELIRWIYGFESGGYNLPNGLTCQEVINLINHNPSVYYKVQKIQRKNYFEELEEWYKKNEVINTNKAINIDRKKGRPKNEEVKQDVQSVSSGVGGARSRGRPSGKR